MLSMVLRGLPNRNVVVLACSPLCWWLLWPGWWPGWCPGVGSKLLLPLLLVVPGVLRLSRRSMPHLQVFDFYGWGQFGSLQTTSRKQSHRLVVRGDNINTGPTEGCKAARDLTNDIFLDHYQTNKCVAVNAKGRITPPTEDPCCALCRSPLLPHPLYSSIYYY